MRTLIMLVCLGCLAGCGDDGPDAPPRLPQLVDNGGPRLGHVQVVPIYFADDPDAGVLTAFYRWIVTSSWLTTVGAEYGVGHGSVLATVQRTDAAPLEIDDAQIIDLLYQGLADGSLPQPTTDGGDVLYVVHFPLQTTVTAGSGTSCVDFGGYHASARRDGVELAYAVIPACSEFARGFLDVEGREYAASHELIEAATDPYPANQPGFQLRDRTSTWRALGEEVGDLCVRGDETGVHREAGFVATRSWSNAAAAAEQDPCLPAQGPATYFNVVTSSRTVLRIPPGSHQPVELVAWAQDTLPDWTVSVQAADDTQATLTLGVTQLGPGKSATLDFAVAASTAIGAPVRGYVVSAGTSTYQYLPLLAIAGQPCESFSGCEDCTSHEGCGFCATTGKCETLDVSGATITGCPASKVALWPGSCSGFCEAHGASCAECASQGGCGWCAASNTCMEASQEYSHPQNATCAYADWSFTPGYCPR